MSNIIDWLIDSPLKYWFFWLIFLSFTKHHYGFPKIWKSWYLAYLKVLQAQKKCSKFQNLGLSTKKVIETQKCTQAAWPAQFLSIFNILWQLRGVITFERIISLCWDFQDIPISYILFIWKSLIRIWMGHVPTFAILVHLTWNDPKRTETRRKQRKKCTRRSDWRRSDEERLREVVVRRCSVKEVFLEISQKSQENTCARVSFLIKLLIKRLWHRCSPVNFAMA